MVTRSRAMLEAVDAELPYGAILLLLSPVALGLWVLRKQDRIFPERFDRTSWSPEPGRARCFETMWAWLADCGGPGRGGRVVE